MTTQEFARWLEVILDWNGDIPDRVQESLNTRLPVAIKYTESDDDSVYIITEDDQHFTLTIHDRTQP